MGEAARKLLTRKGRDEQGAFLVHGRKLIEEAVRAGFEIETLFVNAGALARGEIDGKDFAEPVALAETLFCELARTVTPQPYIAAVRRADGAAGTSRVLPSAGRVLILDRVSDPGNAGTLIRTALAAGVNEAWLLKGTTDVFSDKALRASAGAVFHLPLREGLSANGAIDMARRLGARLIVCAAGGADLYETDLTGAVCIVIGNEGAGADSAFLEAADAVCGIPMADASESLNAAAAAAIVLYEAFRQTRVGSGIR